MIDAILSRLHRVKKTGRGSWLACCPAHNDRSPSMTLRECDDGRILAHCFGGCSIAEIVASVGLGWDEWFPEKPQENAKPYRRPFPSADVLEAVASDSALIAVTVANMANGEKITPEDYLAMLNAAGRIAEARRIAIG